MTSERKDRLFKFDAKAVCIMGIVVGILYIFPLTYFLSTTISLGLSKPFDWTYNFVYIIVPALMLVGFGFLIFKNAKFLRKIIRNEHWEKSTLWDYVGMNLALLLFFVLMCYVIWSIMVGYANKGSY